MKCANAVELIHAALDGEAPAELLARLHEHLGECSSCARESEALRHWDTVLRAPDTDEPGDAYFDALARRVSARVRERDRQPAPRLAPSWRLSWAFATACLVLGLAFGHLAFPRTITHTQTVVKAVPGPVRTVTVEKPVPVRVEVPLVEWRTRTVVRETPATRPTTTVADTAHAGTRLTMPAASAPVEAGEAMGEPLTADEQPKDRWTAGQVYYAAWRPQPSVDTGLSRTEMTALARRLTTDVTTLDRALNSPRLAETLVSNVDSADAELERAIQPAASGEPHQ
jgi:anti-sigma factor RsiW